MADATKVYSTVGGELNAEERCQDPCVMVIFGASGDLTKRLLMPAIYNLACDGLLPERFAIIGIAMDEMTTDEFQAKMSKDIREFSTRDTFDEAVWNDLVKNLHYTSGKFDDPSAFERLKDLVTKLDGQLQAKGNVLFYMAVPPFLFGMISSNLEKVGFRSEDRGWKRIIVEKPFGNDLASAIELNKEILTYWDEKQVYRIDHYLGKETVQNILTFRFANGIYEPLWNQKYVDHIQMTVSESVGVEGRGNYYDRSGVLRDMIQNHMFQMLAYVCMEPPSSFEPDAIRDEKAKLLRSIRVFTPEEVAKFTIRGQYGPGRKKNGDPAVGYREEPDVPETSNTETFAAMRLFIDNWRWDGVPVYLRSGKALSKKGTEVVVQFKKAPEVLWRDTPSVKSLDANRLLFHIQPDQGIEQRFQAKIPGPSLQLQKVGMHFSYGEAFKAARGTGYEVLIYNCMIGDATLFSRTDLVETAWRIAQPMLDYWKDHEPSDPFPNYPAGSWGPASAYDLIEADGRNWYEVINRDVLERVKLFQGADPMMLQALIMQMSQVKYAAGEEVVRKGDSGDEMYFICRGKVEVHDGAKVLAKLEDGDFFGEVGLLLSQPRIASVRATSDCDMFRLSKADLMRVLRDHPQFASQLYQVACDRYDVTASAQELFDPFVADLVAPVGSASQ